MSQSAQAVFIVHKNVGYLFQKVLMGRRSRCGARSLTQCHLRVLGNGGGVCDEGEGNQGMGSNLRSMSFLFPPSFSHFCSFCWVEVFCTQKSMLLGRYKYRPT